MNYAVKALGQGKIEAYAIRWGSPAEPDRSPMRDYFTPQTDLMLDEWGWPRPILLDHMVTREGDAAGSIGQWHGATKDRIGVKLTGQLKITHPLYPRLDADIRAGKYYLSSDSASHLVKRRRSELGTHEITRWGLLTASITKSPAEHRLMPVAAIKSLALKAGARHSAGDARDMQTIHDLSVAQGAMCAADRVKARLTRELDRLEREIALEHELALLEK